MARTFHIERAKRVDTVTPSYSYSSKTCAEALVVCVQVDTPDTLRLHNDRNDKERDTQPENSVLHWYFIKVPCLPASTIKTVVSLVSSLPSIV